MSLFPLAILAHSLSFYFLYRISNPLSLHNSSICSLKFVGVHDYIMISLMWVGSDVIILDIKSISLEMVVVALELISASKWLLGSDTPQGNTEP